MIDSNTGHFGFSAKIVKVGTPEPTCEMEYHFGNPTGDWKIVDDQFGFDKKSLDSDVRYYISRVERD